MVGASGCIAHRKNRLATLRSLQVEEPGKVGSGEGAGERRFSGEGRKERVSGEREGGETTRKKGVGGKSEEGEA